MEKQCPLKRWKEPVEWMEVMEVIVMFQFYLIFSANNHFY